MKTINLNDNEYLGKDKPANYDFKSKERNTYAGGFYH